MIFGMPTLIESNSLEESMEFCKELGLQFLELNMNLPQYQVKDLENIEYLRSFSRKYEIFYTIHLDENLNISDFNPLITNAYMETVKRTIEAAKQLEIPILNMHMNQGVYFTLPDQKIYLYKKYKNVYLKRMKEFSNQCMQWIGESNIHICLENTGGFMDFEKEAVELLLESKVFSLTWDIGHSNACENVDESFLLKHQEKLRHFHIHDGRKKANHLALGEGEMNLIERLDLAKKHNCRCVIETKTKEAMKISTQWLKEHSYL